MSATIANAYGYDNIRTKETHRLGSQAAQAEANTWRTFTTCYVNRDGVGHIEVKRDGKTLHYFSFEKESE